MPLRHGETPSPDQELDDGEWRLVYPGVDLRFGDWHPYFLDGPPDLGEVVLAVQDAPHAIGDGVLFGRDTRAGRTITLPLGVNETDEASALEAHSALSAAWRGDRVRKVPGAVAELYVRRSGRGRVVFGRPRKFATELHMDYRSGYSAATAEFACADDVFYDANLTSITLGLVPPPSGGIAPPFTPPFSTVPRSTRPGLVTTNGLVDTWPILTLAGPIFQPRVQLTGLWTIQLDTTLAWDQSVTIDTRPWVRTVLRNDGANLAGALGRASTKLAKASVPAQTETEVLFSGTDPTGTSRLTVAWRDAYTHL